jgi:hypothetical protein
MREPGSGATLTSKASTDLRVLKALPQDLDGHGPVQDLVPAQKDPRHATRPYLAFKHKPAVEASHRDLLRG